MISLASVGVFLALLSRVHSDVVLIQPPAETARPGESVRLTCKTSGFDLSSYWMHLVRQVPGQGLEWLLAYYSSSSKYFAPGIQDRFTPSKDSPKNMFIVDVSRLQTDDTAVYYCAVYSYGGIGYWGGGTMLTVTAAEDSKPTLYPLLSCEQSSADEKVTFGCLATDYSPMGINVYWENDEANITTGTNTYPAVLNKNGTYTRSSEITVRETPTGSSAIYCVVQYNNTLRKIRIPPETPLPDVIHPTVFISVNPLDDIRRNRKGTAVCSIMNFRPAGISVDWLKNGQPVHSGVVTSADCEANGNFSATSQMTFPATEWFEGVVYTCQVTHKNDMQSRNISNNPDIYPCDTIQVTIQEPPVEQVLLEASLTLTCFITNAPYGVQVSWMQGKNELKSEIAYQPGNSPHSVISNLNISTQSWWSGEVFECVVSHEEMPTPKRAYIRREEAVHPQKPSVSVLLPSTSEESTENSVILTCLVRGFSPRRIFVTWAVDDTRVDSRNYTNTAVAAENGNNSFFMYSLLSVRSEQWLRGASFSCIVGHETLPMKTIARTVNRSSGKPSFVNISLVLMDTVDYCQ